MEVPRHSADVPISRTLVALRRVRSLRDPSTNSMSKLSSLIDHVHWENGSSNGISLRFLDANPASCDFDDDSNVRSKDLGFVGKMEHGNADFALSNCSLLNSKVKSSGVSSCHEGQLYDQQAYSDPQQQGICGNKLQTQSCRGNNEDGSKALDLPCNLLPSNHFNDGESCYVASTRSSQLGRIDHTKSAKKSLRKNQVKPSELVGGIVSRLGSPCLSVGDAFSPHSSSMHIPHDVDDLDENDKGCGISCCWSKSPRFRETTNHYCEIDDGPLISHHGDETELGRHRSMRLVSGEISPNLETPRNLSMKFRPKSFSDLVGQNVVVRSLLGAIFTERITSFYIFHGPRGTGKTSASRIFAAALNCISVGEQKPCGMCRECVLFFSGRSKDVKEVDSIKMNCSDQVKSLLKKACFPPVSSRFKVFIIDECQLLNGDTWASLLNGLENLAQHVVFVMITPDLDKLPRCAVSRAQRHHFPKIKDADIASRLEKICSEESIDAEQAALDFIAAKSCGSVRDAEMMLDQLSLLGNKITVSLAHELTGIVSDDELLNLLDLALSSDTSNTVIRARELMRSRIDPLQLISQLANLIMDILAGKCEDNVSEFRSRFSSRYTSEVDLQKLNHALKILSETEKQLRVSKNQTTWFTVALLQLSSAEYPSAEANDNKLCLRGTCNGDGDCCSSSSTEQSLKHLSTAQCGKKSHTLGVHEDHKRTLDSIWYKATELSQSSQLKKFLRKQGTLSSLRVDCNNCVAIADLEFHHRSYVSKAEKSWKLIASSLQFILGCNIELRINYVPCASDSKYARLKRTPINFFSCTRRIQQRLFSPDEQGSEESDYGDYGSENPMMMNNKNQTPSCDCGGSYHGIEVVATLRSSEGNLLRSGKRFMNRSSCTSSSPCAHLIPSTMDSDNNQSNKCFPQTLWIQKKFSSSYSSKLTV